MQREIELIPQFSIDDPAVSDETSSISSLSAFLCTTKGDEVSLGTFLKLLPNLSTGSLQGWRNRENLSEKHVKTSCPYWFFTRQSRQQDLLNLHHSSIRSCSSIGHAGKKHSSFCCENIALGTSTSNFDFWECCYSCIGSEYICRRTTMSIGCVCC